jgi:hypothetical protein
VTDNSCPMPRYSSLKRSTKPIRAKKKRSSIRDDGEPVRVLWDGREVCNDLTAAGRREYRTRTLEMRLRQRSICCMYRYCPTCPGYLPEGEATFEHEMGRTAGHRDDRIEVDGKWINGAAHSLCNQWKGSRKMPYNVPFNSFARPEHSKGMKG